MNIRIILSVMILMISSRSFSQSILDYNLGTNIDVQSGASVCADSIILDGTFSGGGTICGVYTMNLTVIVEGLYNSSTDFMIADTATVFIRNTVSPYAIVESYKGYLNSSGTGTFVYMNAIDGGSYFIDVTHRNSIETWSKTPQSFVSNNLNYSFKTGANQAYGDNMTQVDLSPLTFAIYSGDVNQDGAVDATDNSLIDNDIAIFATGYLPTDVNGDDIVDASDALIADNNSAMFVTAVLP